MATEAVYDAIVSKLAVAFGLTSNIDVFLSPVISWLPSQRDFMIQVIPGACSHNVDGGSIDRLQFNFTVGLFHHSRRDRAGRWHVMLTETEDTKLFAHRETLIETLQMDFLNTGSTDRLVRPIMLLSENPIQVHQTRPGNLCWVFTFSAGLNTCLVD